jgi:hypothetical protein
MCAEDRCLSADLVSHLGPHALGHAFATRYQMTGVASDASFPGKRERVLPEPQHVGLQRRAGHLWQQHAMTCDVITRLHLWERDDAPNSVASDIRMMRRMQRKGAATRSDATTVGSSS